MGLGSFSDKELKVLSDKFSYINSSLSDVEKNLRSEIENIQKKISSLSDTGTTILDEPTIKDLFDKVKRQFQENQEKLKKSIEEFQAASAAYEDQRQKQLEKEEELIKRESQADANFASKHDLLVAPVKRYREALEAKEHELVRSQEEYILSFQKREQKLNDEFTQLKEQQAAAFDESMKKLDAERQALAARENAVSQREKDVNAREIEVKEGLAQERSQMMNEIGISQNEIEEQKQDLAQQQQKLKQDKNEFETEKGELQKRAEDVYDRECQADKDFAVKRQEMQNDIENLRRICLNQIRDEEKKASDNRAELLNSIIKSLEDERSRSINALKDEMEKIRQDAYSEISEARAKFDAEKESFLKEKESVESKRKELQKRELEIKVREERQNQEKAYIAEKMRIDEEKFRKLAETEVAAAMAELTTEKKIYAELSEQFTQMRFKYEEQKAINDRFKDKSPEEVYALIKKLEEENDRLKTEIKSR